MLQQKSRLKPGNIFATEHIVQFWLAGVNFSLSSLFLAERSDTDVVF